MTEELHRRKICIFDPAFNFARCQHYHNRQTEVMATIGLYEEQKKNRRLKIEKGFLCNERIPFWGEEIKKNIAKKNKKCFRAILYI